MLRSWSGTRSQLGRLCNVATQPQRTPRCCTPAGAGLRPGDHLLRVGVVEVEGQEWGDIFRRTYADSIGSSIEVEVERSGERVVGRGTLGTRTRVEHHLEPLAGASELQNAVRRGIVTGRTR